MINKIVLGSDHGAIEARNKVAHFLKSTYPKIEIIILGPENPKEKEDYTKVVKNAGKIFNETKEKVLVVLFCTTGMGILIGANKIENVRAIPGISKELVKKSRNHNDPNALCFGATPYGNDSMEEIIQEFINTRFIGYDKKEERHLKRVNKLTHKYMNDFQKKNPN